MLADYSSGPEREMRLDPMVYGFLQGRHGHMSRQFYVRFHGAKRPKRIDFRYGTSNPAVIELAVRPPTGGSQLHGSQTESELRKLTRVPQAKAKRRILLLLDLYRSPLDEAKLKATYDSIHAGRGNFKRHSVRVIYVHRDSTYDFLWWPKKVKKK